MSTHTIEMIEPEIAASGELWNEDRAAMVAPLVTVFERCYYRGGEELVTFAKNNGGPADTKYHPLDDPANTITASRENTSLVTGPIEPVDRDEIRFRMLIPETEIRDIMAYQPDWKAVNPDGSEPTKEDVCRLLGDGVTPPVLEWLTNQTLEIMA